MACTGGYTCTRGYRIPPPLWGSAQNGRPRKKHLLTEKQQKLEEKLESGSLSKDKEEKTEQRQQSTRLPAYIRNAPS